MSNFKKYCCFDYISWLFLIASSIIFTFFNDLYGRSIIEQKLINLNLIIMFFISIFLSFYFLFHLFYMNKKLTGRTKLYSIFLFIFEIIIFGLFGTFLFFILTITHSWFLRLMYFFVFTTISLSHIFLQKIQINYI